jgi:hypothetical protein
MPGSTAPWSTKGNPFLMDAPDHASTCDDPLMFEDR